jgi:hypothetical protein
MKGKILAALASASLAACGQTPNAQTESEEIAAMNAKTAAINARLAQWQYSDEVDEMRGHTMHVALKLSENKQEVAGAPNTTAALMMRQAGKLTNLWVAVGDGVPLECNSANPYWSAKFDDGTVEKLECDDHVSSTMVQLDPKNIARIKTSKRLIIEVPVSGGTAVHQFKWNVEGLKWPQAGAAG